MKFSRLLIISVLATFFQFNSVSAECIFGPMLGDDISKVEEKYGPADEISDKESIISTMIDDICPGDNLGNSIFKLSCAIKELRKIGLISKIADIYISKPFGYKYQNNFYNIKSLKNLAKMDL